MQNISSLSCIYYTKLYLYIIPDLSIFYLNFVAKPGSLGNLIMPRKFWFMIGDAIYEKGFLTRSVRLKTRRELLQ